MLEKEPSDPSHSLWSNRRSERSVLTRSDENRHPRSHRAIDDTSCAACRIGREGGRRGQVGGAASEIRTTWRAFQQRLPSSTAVDGIRGEATADSDGVLDDGRLTGVVEPAGAAGQTWVDGLDAPKTPTRPTAARARVCRGSAATAFQGPPQGPPADRHRSRPLTGGADEGRRVRPYDPSDPAVRVDVRSNGHDLVRSCRPGETCQVDRLQQLRARSRHEIEAHAVDLGDTETGR